jgi:hypothetical protein
MKVPLIRIFSGVIILIGVILSLYWLIFNKNSAVVVQWNTESEIDTAGFYLYRSISKEGPFEQINNALILASSDKFTGGSYTYDDKDVIAGQTYFYQLEDVDLAGNTSIHGPIEVTAGRGNSWGLGIAAVFIFIGMVGLIYSLKLSL